MPVHRAAEVVLVFSIVGGVSYAIGYMAKRGEKLNTTENAFSILISDLLRALFSYLFMCIYEKQYKIVYVKEYLVCGFLSFFQSLAWLFSYQYIFAIISQILTSSRSLFVFLLSSVVFRKRYTKTQWFSQMILLFGLFLPFLYDSYIKPAGSFEAQAKGNYNLLYIALVVLACLSSAFNGVYFEKTIKKKKISLWSNGFNYSISTIGFSFLFLIFHFSFFSGSINEFGKIFKMSILRTIEGLVYSYVIVYYGALLKSFLQIVLHAFISIILAFHMEEKISFIQILSLGITMGAIAIFKYSGPDKKHIFEKENI
ncbi:solute carrier family 35 (UDP-sugar transporter), member A1/2/3 [Nematocida sp. LUAm3]|nr:solute carrier family 35 (UDP-sugar transporter), member A1/2/3 [Nematocida sp. LUAm3]KAI5174699.1 solute carrier family 35 (UDP-sugar transporter), member A1/2/3 [Nematocida sp. LUAm2]KAI5177890.1 solute carrier family 35 (UDP-sugar transporter), member A1/2/3 [Nematocida sp. LUAm1]